MGWGEVKGIEVWINYLELRFEPLRFKGRLSRWLIWVEEGWFGSIQWLIESIWTYEVQWLIESIQWLIESIQWLIESIWVDLRWSNLRRLFSSKWDPKAEIDISTLPCFSESDFLKINSECRLRSMSDQEIRVNNLEDVIVGPLRLFRKKWN